MHADVRRRPLEHTYYIHYVYMYSWFMCVCVCSTTAEPWGSGSRPPRALANKPRVTASRTETCPHGTEMLLTRVTHNQFDDIKTVSVESGLFKFTNQIWTLKSGIFKWTNHALIHRAGNSSRIPDPVVVHRLSFFPPFEPMRKYRILIEGSIAPPYRSGRFCGFTQVYFLQIDFKYK